MKNAGNQQASKPAIVRCAIYCRKSTEEGLDQDFNSLDAQREAAEAFIQSQREQGWQILPERYDDGGYTGGNMDRPALQRLLADIEAGKVDTILVYKVDRLSRSLLDFARIMEILDRHHVAFVSVTQSFNTSTSMGRLMLHVLFSFAEFERETISERVRDKMGAARRKGRWVGGHPFLGFDVDHAAKKMVVNEAEAVQVREIFGLYLKERALLPVVQELHRRGWTTKSWTSKRGKIQPGRQFTKQNLFLLLRNVGYAGQVKYKGTCYPGEHPAIVDQAVWDKAQEILHHNCRSGGKEVRNKNGALLKGMVRCLPCGTSMVATYTRKNDRLYKFYVCLRAQKEGWDSCPSKSVPAHEIEKFVIDRIRGIGKDPSLVSETLAQVKTQREASVKTLKAEQIVDEKRLRDLNQAVRRLVGKTDGNGTTSRLADLQDQINATQNRLLDVKKRILETAESVVDEKDLAQALSTFDPLWDELFPKEQARILKLLVEQVGYDGGKGTLAVTFRPTGIKALASELGNGNKDG